VLIAFVLALIIGGVAGYYGGWIDGVIQMITDAVRTVPAIPLFMAMAAFVPDTWSAERGSSSSRSFWASSAGRRWRGGCAPIC
jgi:ABC-type dipeptide/oligopeptide/nickel transport system permease subunit